MSVTTTSGLTGQLPRIHWATLGFILCFTGNLFAQTDHRLIVPDDGQDLDFFGSSLAADNGYLAVGSQFDDDLSESSGSVYVFDTLTGSQLHKLTPSNAEEGEAFFGSGVALHGDTLAVHSIRGAYLFDVTTGKQLSHIDMHDGYPDATFLSSIDLNGDRLILGGSFADLDEVDRAGSATVYDISDPSQPQPISHLVASDAKPFSGFGNKVRIEDNLAIIGSFTDPTTANQGGAVYLYDVDSGEEIAKIVPSDIDPQNHFFGRFGGDFDYADDRLLVGAAGTSQLGLFTGSAYLYDLSDPTDPIELKIFQASDAASRMGFGGRVAMGGGLLYVGTVDERPGITRALYLYDATSLSELAEFPTPFGPTTLFGDDGTRMVYADGYLFVGDPRGSGPEFASGVVHVIPIPEPSLTLLFVLVALRITARHSVYRNPSAAWLK